MDQIVSLVLVYAVFIGALAVPGPDFLVTVRNALGGSARAGVLTAAGIASALAVHIGYCLAGIGLLISQSILLFTLVKSVGAVYLIYIGVQALRARPAVPEGDEPAVTGAGGVSGRRAYISGFVTNLFNPKATLFFLALFSQMLSPELPLSLTLGFGGLCMVTAFVWFSAVSFIMASAPVRRGYQRLAGRIERVFGAFFIALGLKLALSSR